MPRKGKEKKFDEKLFLSALEQLGSAKGISSDVIVEAISDSFKIAFTKKLEDEDRIFYNSKKVKDNKKLVANKALKLDDALVRCDIDLKLGKIVSGYDLLSWALESIRLICYALPKVLQNPHDTLAREMLSAAATLPVNILPADNLCPHPDREPP